MKTNEQSVLHRKMNSNVIKKKFQVLPNARFYLDDIFIHFQDPVHDVYPVHFEGDGT